MDNKKEKERVTKSITISISIPEKLYKELSDLAEEKEKTISQVIKTTLRHARAALWDAEYSEILKHLRREEPRKEEDLGRLRGGPLDYGPIRFRLVHPPSYEQIVEKARSYGVDIPSDQKPHSQKKKKIKL